MSSEALPVAPPAVQADLAAATTDAPLRSSENALAVLEVDLSRQLRFAANKVVITNQRLLSRFPNETGWQSWDLRQGLTLTHHDHAGVGSLELRDAAGQLAVWRFTLGHNPAALRFLGQFEQAMAALAPGGAVSRLPAEAADAEEPDEVAEDKPPSTWTLFRLWRFAKPYQWQLLAGFLLTLAATAAQLVPPYLTMPLMDKVLIPFQNGQQID
ncbi:MAG TPA: ABC transporter, partial [Ottowia sp.]|nr:ABC transporter [Ottowia sp.]